MRGTHFAKGTGHVFAQDNSMVPHDVDANIGITSEIIITHFCIFLSLKKYF